jgi:hypothetical protein
MASSLAKAHIPVPGNRMPRSLRWMPQALPHVVLPYM